jgi:hypothetical protein
VLSVEAELIKGKGFLFSDSIETEIQRKIRK